MTQAGQPQDPRAAARRALLGLEHPRLQARNFVELGMIPDVRVEDGHVVVTLALPVRQTPARKQFEQMVKTTVGEACPGWPVEVAVREMTPEERAGFAACAEGRAPLFGDQQTVHCVVAVMSGKGGVGKSSVAGASGVRASEKRAAGRHPGRRHHRAQRSNAVRRSRAPRPGRQGIGPPKHGTGIKLMSINLLLPNEDQPVIWRGPLIGRTIQQFWNDIAWGELDVLVVDLPPGTRMPR